MKKILLAVAVVFGLHTATMAQTGTAPKPATQKATGAHLKKDGTVDKRYAENKHLKKDGTPDKRYKAKK